MGVGYPCPPVRNDIVTQRHLFPFLFLFLLLFPLPFPPFFFLLLFLVPFSPFFLFFSLFAHSFFFILFFFFFIKKKITSLNWIVSIHYEYIIKIVVIENLYYILTMVSIYGQQQFHSKLLQTLRRISAHHWRSFRRFCNCHCRCCQTPAFLFSNPSCWQIVRSFVCKAVEAPSSSSLVTFVLLQKWWFLSEMNFHLPEFLQRLFLVCLDLFSICWIYLNHFISFSWSIT